MMKLRRSSTNEEEGNQSGKRSERDQRRGGELCNGGRLLPVPAEVTHRSEEERETEPGRERERERERVTAEASQSLEQQPDGRLSIWRRAREAQTGMWSGSAQDICTPAAEIHMLRLVEGRNTRVAKAKRTGRVLQQCFVLMR
ncbi:uncharacterized protein LOC124401350 isoform X20 [Silurus meridionalis]|uniref:uncharacterized protein LOC124401350 isoform X20 n=1 Tax=Silurus meridionalis TaxID=175797 RepID=UPI001EEB8AB3|nr:uncharacterized protein LOC124401350 isoform X20 [Silurus meridionalis]